MMNSLAKQGMDIGVFNYIMKLNMFDEIDKVFKKAEKFIWTVLMKTL